jgi:hypothetical protein
MSIFKGIKTKNALSRLQEEQLYEFILNEMEANIIRKGLMAKAIAQSEGDEGKSKAAYIKLRLQSLIDENTVMEAIQTIVSPPQSNTAFTAKKNHTASTKKQVKGDTLTNEGSFQESLEKWGDLS